QYLYCCICRRGERALGMVAERVAQRLGPQQAADVVGPERGTLLYRFGHDRDPRFTRVAVASVVEPRALGSRPSTLRQAQGSGRGWRQHFNRRIDSIIV